jgi:hypothetical protein
VPAKAIDPEAGAQHRRELRRRRDRGLAFGLSAVGIGALGSALGLSLNAQSLHDQFVASGDETLKRQLRSNAQTQALAGDILYGIGAAAVVVSIYFYYRGFRHERRTPAHAALR